MSQESRTGKVSCPLTPDLPPLSVRAGPRLRSGFGGADGGGDRGGRGGEEEGEQGEEEEGGEEEEREEE